MWLSKSSLLGVHIILREEMKYQICKENGIRLIRVKEVLNIEVKTLLTPSF